ncbi:MAG: ATP-binding protein [Aquisalimonadaceae bacterium]
MTLYQPKSLLKLVLYGFGFVSLPLILALGYAAVHVDRVAHQSQYAVYQAVQAISNSRQLIDLLTSMERTGRQYLILGDDTLIEAYTDLHEQFRDAAQRLHRLPLDDDQRDQVDNLMVAERALFQNLTEGDGADMDQLAMVTTFQDLNGLAQQVLSGSNRMVDREVQVMQETASAAQRLLFWLAVSVPPLTILSAGVFAVLISRPVRQLDRAIRRLGDGHFTHPVKVTGPQDLQHLGNRLDWMRQRLQDLEEQKSRFLRHMSHELKTPLTAIREGAELLQDNAVGPLNVEQQEVAAILQSNAMSLQRLIEDLLNFGTSRGGNSGMLRLNHVRLIPVMDAVTRNHKPALLAKDVTLETWLHDLHLMADEEKLRTIIDNLLSNAIKFSPENSRVLLIAERRGDNVVIEVADEGPGIAAEDRDSVFDAFYQGRNKASGYVKGSGLGLSIAREYVEAHGGRIEVDGSESPGTRLRVTLPLTQQGYANA